MGKLGGPGLYEGLFSRVAFFDASMFQSRLHV
jgi:hypothetical protein